MLTSVESNACQLQRKGRNYRLFNERDNLNYEQPTCYFAATEVNIADFSLVAIVLLTALRLWFQIDVMAFMRTKSVFPELFSLTPPPNTRWSCDFAWGKKKNGALTKVALETYPRACLSQCICSERITSSRSWFTKSEQNKSWVHGYVWVWYLQVDRIILRY